MSRHAVLQTERDLFIVARHDPLVGCGRLRCDKFRAAGQIVVRSAVIDLRRIGNTIVPIKHLESRRIDAAACDRARPVLRICDGIVPAKGIADARVLHRTAAGIYICTKRCACAIAKTTGHAREIDIPRRVAVRSKHGVARRTVSHSAQGSLCVGRRPVIDLRRGSECECHGARRDRAESCQRCRACNRRRVRCCIERIVVRLICIRNGKGGIIGNILCCRNTTRIGDVL